MVISVKGRMLSASGAAQAGPEDYSGRTPSGEPKGPGKRRSKIEHGESVKRGCQAHFTVRCYAVGVCTSSTCLDMISFAGVTYCPGPEHSTAESHKPLDCNHQGNLTLSVLRAGCWRGSLRLQRSACTSRGT